MAENLADNITTAPKPGVLSLAIKEKAALYAAYMPYLKGGGLFIPTSKSFKIGEEVFMLLSLIDDPMKLKVVGHVVWVTPAAQAGRPQGVGVQFSDRDGGLEAKNKIENLLGSALKSSRPTNTM
ncbi:PilZ domain-containing protein [Methylotenera sp.]|jgi:type IV pilus assembly protein PilZ|uniref:PilZ domain-containing protein n=1 Tax=Methylotenera sp. TaxID=2051956 RepID=UPI00271B93D1|nr:PilZ domain-containing protein [Methylotenera sp.]MDO9204690.1 PilZ domain-containing protein [Methylotenera sp.]MDO9394606.1 PilZ domain-containing protein [Methylotenera sp.]MDP1522852.1 PilZ domain-containing protein [Methylotenera sp.]MDP1766992.1 PilZ domain-containing protein [Methylotenera sp.]MDP2071547.1 PilZ domain-containing protein [Methylotenera sp.]